MGGKFEANVETRFVLTVANGGTPIPDAARDKLFEPFYRGDGPSDTPGLGLGLHIAAEIARAHNGTLEVHSDANETCFTFAMPLGSSDV
ncbi:sensor histidine kinase [Novosphingobium sp. G106]|uniref:sensor histidine kinase n=1 Tax=Novosphingobium sp. G106 TaxID=2849500 RepID=UPI0035C82B92